MNELLKNPILIAIINSILILGVLFNVYQLYSAKQIENQLKENQQLMATLQERLLDARNSQDYYSSNLFAEKYSRELNLKKRGEVVIDTDPIEKSNENANYNYIPDENDSKSTNFEIWTSCLFPVDRNPCLE